MEKLFDSHEIDDLKQQVEKLESSSQQEDLAVDMLLLLSMKLRGTFPTPATAIKFFLKRWELKETYLAKVLAAVAGQARSCPASATSRCLTFGRCGITLESLLIFCLGIPRPQRTRVSTLAVTL